MPSKGSLADDFYTPAFDYFKFILQQEIYGLWIEVMLYFVNFLFQGWKRIIFFYSYRFLQYYRSMVDFLIYKMDSYACDFNAIFESIFYSVGAREGW